jgi:hypothetical protein
MKGYVVNVYAPFIRACEKLLYKTSHNNFSQALGIYTDDREWAEATFNTAVLVWDSVLDWASVSSLAGVSAEAYRSVLHSLCQ